MVSNQGVFSYSLRSLSFVLMLAMAQQAMGTITFTGEVTPSSPGDNDLETTLEIGEGSNPEDVDPRATVRVDGGSSLEFDQVYVGSDDGFFGRLYIDGDLTSFVIEESGSSSEPALQVGRNGDGYLSVTGGAHLNLTHNNSDVSIGDNTSGYGTAIISGDFTLVTIGQNLTVGDAGIGNMEIRDGALVRTLDSSTAGVTIGATTTGIGSLLVDGQFSRLQIGDDLTVGGAGIGTLTISNQAVVDADSSGNATTIGTGGRVVLSNGTLRFDTLTVNGVLEGSGLLQGDGAGAGLITINDTARILNKTGDLLQVAENVNNQGTIDIEGGEIVFNEAFTNNAIGANNAPGRLSLGGGRVTFSNGLTNNGVISIAAGDSDLHGAISNETGASVSVARDAVATFHDSFTDNGGTLTVLAGGNALFLSDLTFQAASALSLSLEQDLEAPLGSGAPLSVAGITTLAGDLTVTVADDFIATLGDTFTLLSSTSVAGVFDTTTLPDLPGTLEFGLITTATGVSLQVQVETNTLLEGDFNFDGTVDAADYTVWRDGLGTTFVQGDYDLWVANYGTTINSTSSSQAVPEPTTILLMAFAVGAFSCRRSS